MTSKFEDIVFLIETGTAAASIATAASNPVIAASLDGANRLIRIGMDAYASGRDRGEWTPAEEKRFDEVVLPAVTSQPHWVKKPETGEEK
jgi:hypothetical protein